MQHIFITLHIILYRKNLTGDIKQQQDLWQQDLWQQEHDKCVLGWFSEN